MPNRNDALIAELRKLAERALASPVVSADVTVRGAAGESVTLAIGAAQMLAGVNGSAPDEPGDESSLGPSEVPIVEAVRKAGEPLTREQIASKLSPKRNPKSGSFRRTLESLTSEEREVLVETADGKYGLHPDFQT
jgi:hypothetical protein